MKRTTVATAALVALLTLASAALAITYGEPDGNRHPNVGALLAPTAYSDGTWVTCSGTLIRPEDLPDSRPIGAPGEPILPSTRRRATRTTSRSSSSTSP